VPILEVATGFTTARGGTMELNRVLRIAGACALAAALASCDADRQPARPNIVLVVVDSMRPDHMTQMGYGLETAPFLTQMSKEGAVFRTAYSTSSWSAPATASLITSLYPVQHGVHLGLLATETLQAIDPSVTLNRLPDGVTTMAEALKQAGYSTWGVSDDVNVGHEMAFDQGFDRFEHMRELGAPRVNAVASSWASELRGSRPYFLYLHYSDPRRPYTARAPWYKPKYREREDRISAYDSEISYVDSCIAELHDLLGWERDTWVIVTAPHGEELGDHGEWYHGRTLYREVLNVPLIVSFPEGYARPRHVLDPVSIVDVHPTVRAIAGLPADPGDQGVSLLPLVRNEGALPEDRVLFADLRSGPWYGSVEMRAAIRGTAKYVLVLPDREELYNPRIDPKEKSSLAWSRPDLVAELRAAVEKLEVESPRYGGAPPRVALDEATVERLRSAVYAN
jgi:arylsulfatase A-like enzyme